MNTAIALTPKEETQQQHIDGLYALLDTSGHGEILWEKLDTTARTCFCKLAGLKQKHINLPLSLYTELERHKLLRAIKHVEQLAKPFAGLSLSDFK